MKNKDIILFKKMIFDNEELLKNNDIFCHFNVTDDEKYFTFSIYHYEDCNSEAVEEASVIRNISNINSSINVLESFIEEIKSR